MPTLWIVLCIVFLVVVAGLMRMAREPFPPGQRIVPAVFGTLLGAGTFLTLVRWGEVRGTFALAAVFAAVSAGLFWPEIMYALGWRSDSDLKAPNK